MRRCVCVKLDRKISGRLKHQYNNSGYFEEDHSIFAKCYISAYSTVIVT